MTKTERVISFLAALVALFVFITGVQSLKQWRTNGDIPIAPHTPSPTAVPTNTLGASRAAEPSQTEVGKPGLTSSEPALRQIIAQMVRDGQLTRECLDRTGNLSEAIGAKRVLLSGEGSQYLMGDGHCGFGARSPVYWLYESRGGTARLLASLGANDGVSVSTSDTNGYNDILVSVYLGGNNEIRVIRWAYDGQRYRQVD